MPIKHAKTSAVVEAADTSLVRPADWNADHTGENYATVQEEGVDLTQRAKLNFIGADVTAADDAANARTNVTVSAPTPKWEDVAYWIISTNGTYEYGVSGTGAGVLAVTFGQLNTGTTSGSHASAGIQVNRSVLSMVNLRFHRFEFATIIAGAVQCDIFAYLHGTRTTGVPTTTQQHYGARVSSAAGAGNWLASVANGTTETTVDSTVAVANGTAYDIAGTFDGTTYKLYLNGVLRGSITTNLPTGGDDLYQRVVVKSNDAADHRVDVLALHTAVLR